MCTLAWRSTGSTSDAEQAQPTLSPVICSNNHPNVRLDYFKAYTVAHPALKQADQAVWNALREPAGAAFIFVVGPTGVGKTTLLTQIEKRLMDLSFSGDHKDRSKALPDLEARCGFACLTQFKWGDYYQRALLLLQEPRVEYTVDYRRQVPVLAKATD